MPAKSEAQQRLMGMALSAKRGKGHFSGKVKEVAESMTEKQLHDFAKTKHEGLSEKKSELIEALKFKIASFNSSLNRIGEVVLGRNYVPQLEGGESMFDALRKRDHEIAVRSMQGDDLANNMVTDKLGLKGHPALKALGYAQGEQIGGLLSPLTGGNRAKAIRNIHEALQNPKVMQSFGRIAPASKNESNEAMEALVRNFHRNESSEADGKAKTSSEKLIGGEGDYTSDSSYPKKELAKGVKHEAEHTKNKSVAKEIAKDHLSERRDYYSRLAKAKID